jgi:hypothetical protein
MAVLQCCNIKILLFQVGQNYCLLWAAGITEEFSISLELDVGACLMMKAFTCNWMWVSAIMINARI